MPDLQGMVIEVKGGKHVTIPALRAFPGVLGTEDAMTARLIVVEPLCIIQERNSRKFMAEIDDLLVNGQPCPRMQFFSVPDNLKDGTL